MEPTASAVEVSAPKGTGVSAAPAITEDAKTVGLEAALTETPTVGHVDCGDIEPVPVNGDVKNKVDQSTGLSDLVNTVAARDGATSAVNYVTSGVGAAVQAVLGVDPVNSAKVCPSLMNSRNNHRLLRYRLQ